MSFGQPAAAVGWPQGVGQLMFGQQPMAFGWPSAAAPAPAAWYVAAPPAGQGQAVEAVQLWSHDHEVAELATQMGIQPSEEERFGWIAEYGMREDALPSRWTSHKEPTSGRTYYADSDSQESRWENPLLPSLLRVLEAGRLYLQQPTDNFFEEQKVLLWYEHKEDLESWHGPLEDVDGQAYFVNSGSGQSSRLDPRQETQYIYKLEAALLEVLESVLREPEAGTCGATRAADAFMDACSSKSFRHRGRHSADSEDRERTLKKMGSTAGWMRAACEEEVEAQRLQFSRKLRERQSRKSSDSLGSASSHSDSGAASGCELLEEAGMDFSLLPLDGTVEQRRQVQMRGRACKFDARGGGSR